MINYRCSFGATLICWVVLVDNIRVQKLLFWCYLSCTQIAIGGVLMPLSVKHRDLSWAIVGSSSANNARWNSQECLWLVRCIPLLFRSMLRRLSDFNSVPSPDTGLCHRFDINSRLNTFARRLFLRTKKKAEYCFIVALTVSLSYSCELEVFVSSRFDIVFIFTIVFIIILSVCWLLQLLDQPQLVHLMTFYVSVPL